MQNLAKLVFAKPYETRICETAWIRLRGGERSGGVAGVSLELGRRASPQGPGVQWCTRAIVSTSRGSSSGGQGAGVSGSGEVHARPRAGSGGVGRTRALSTRIWQAGDGGAESSIPTRKATPAREKTLGRHSSAASRPDPESGDALLWETSVLDPVGEEHPHRAGRRGPAPGAAAGYHSLTMGRQAKGRQPSRASPPRTSRQARSAPP